MPLWSPNRGRRGEKGVAGVVLVVRRTTEMLWRGENTASSWAKVDARGEKVGASSLSRHTPVDSVRCSRPPWPRSGEEEAEEEGGSGRGGG